MATWPNLYSQSAPRSTIVVRDFDIPDADIEVIEYQRDEKIDEAKGAILTFLKENSGSVFYERQLTIIFEKQYFHWITVKALLELTAEGSILSEVLELVPKVPIRFFRMKTNRYWKRQAGQVIKLVRRFSDSNFARAIGLQGELIVDAALPLAGFIMIARNANSFQERHWAKTNHDLDRIVERQGVPYGVEIKNTLPYIDRDEFRIKLEMCSSLGLRPLFVSRMAPKSYNYEMIQRGGISWILGIQYYPFGHDDLANAVQQQLRLPVGCRERIQDGDVARLIKATDWALRHPPAAS